MPCHAIHGCQAGKPCQDKQNRRRSPSHNRRQPPAARSVGCLLVMVLKPDQLDFAPSPVLSLSLVARRLSLVVVAATITVTSPSRSHLLSWTVDPATASLPISTGHGAHHLQVYYYGMYRLNSRGHEWRNEGPLRQTARRCQACLQAVSTGEA